MERLLCLGVWDGSQAGRARRPPFSAEQRQQISRTPLMWQSHLNNTLAADVLCRCPVKIKDSATNAINKLWAGVEERVEGEFKRTLLWLDTDRRRACPCWVSDYPLIWSKSHRKKQGTASACFHSPQHDGVQTTPPPTELLLMLLCDKSFLYNLCCMREKKMLF